MQTISRINTNCLKWDMREMIGGTNEDIPLWIADMDFPVEEKVVEAISGRCKHPIFGYTFQDNTYIQAIKSWYQRHHQLDADIQSFIPSLNVLGTMQVILNEITVPGDKVAMFTPVYPQFYSIIKTSKTVLSEIVIYADSYIDWGEVENVIKDAKVFLFCNPHNPLAKVWTDEECLKLANLCHQYDVWLLSDEVHGDMAMFNFKYHCMANYQHIHDKQIIFTSAAKTFNLAGLGGACLIVPDQTYCQRIKNLLEMYFQTEINCLSAEGIKAAYSYGDTWLKKTKLYLEENVEFLQQYLKIYMPKMQCKNHQGTFLAWIDCRKVCAVDESFIERIKKEGHVLLDDGRRYGAGGEGFIRMNVACDRQLLEQALKNIKQIYENIWNKEGR